MWETALALGAAFGGGERANSANINNAREDRAWQLEQSNTAHQRETRDLVAAGLNPLLSVNAGASTPGGATVAPATNTLGNMVNTGLEVTRLKKDLGQADADIALKSAKGIAANAAAARDVSTATESATRTEALRAQMEAIKAEAGVRTGQAGWDKKLQKFNNINDAIGKGLGNINSVLDAFKPGGPIRAPRDYVRPGQGKTRGGTKFDLNTGEVLP